MTELTIRTLKNPYTVIKPVVSETTHFMPNAFWHADYYLANIGCKLDLGTAMKYLHIHMDGNLQTREITLREDIDKNEDNPDYCYAREYALNHKDEPSVNSMEFYGYPSIEVIREHNYFGLKDV